MAVPRTVAEAAALYARYGIGTKSFADTVRLLGESRCYKPSPRDDLYCYLGKDGKPVKIPMTAGVATFMRRRPEAMRFMDELDERMRYNMMLLFNDLYDEGRRDGRRLTALDCADPGERTTAPLYSDRPIMEQVDHYRELAARAALVPPSLLIDKGDPVLKNVRLPPLTAMEDVQPKVGHGEKIVLITEDGLEHTLPALPYETLVSRINGSVYHLNNASASDGVRVRRLYMSADCTAFVQAQQKAAGSVSPDAWGTKWTDTRLLGLGDLPFEMAARLFSHIPKHGA